jgi:hypothetical protein
VLEQPGVDSGANPWGGSLTISPGLNDIPALTVKGVDQSLPLPTEMGPLMSLAALLAWLITATAGLYLLTIWLIEYDSELQAVAATRLPVPVISTHGLLAVTGLAVWGVYLLTDASRLAWTALLILGVVAVLGFTMAARWITVYRAHAASTVRRSRGSGPAVPPERHFPLPVVIGHGILAATTIVLVLLTTLGIGGS